ncbi:hypothetical protein Btru_022796 [Bulinus truncatus]|nr:hypothetical protein Btru_022796 [Bulinus truncatus]
MASFDERLEKFFREADADKSGSLSKFELCKILQRAGDGRPVAEINDWFDEIDMNRDGSMTLEELKKAMNARSPKDVQETDLRAAFKNFDVDGSGSITVEDLKVVLGKRGMANKAEDFIKEADANQDGKISIEEFIEFWKKG